MRAFPARYETRIELPRTKLDRLIRRAFLFLGWDTERTEPTGTWKASVPLNFCSWGERVTLRAEGSDLVIESRCKQLTQCIDWGKNRRNVRRLCQILVVLDTPL